MMAQNIIEDKSINPLGSHLITEVTTNKPFVFTIDEIAFLPTLKVLQTTVGQKSQRNPQPNRRRDRGMEGRMTGHCKKLPRRISAKAFRTELVLQDPDDEPAEKLLERIKAEKEKQYKIISGNFMNNKGNKKK